METRGAEIRARCTKFSEFVKEAWPLLEPGNPLKWSWHLDAICDHLEAISRGKLTPWLIINVPPGSSKSMIASVLWQAWEWGPLGRPSTRFLTTSFEDKNVKRDTRKTRNLVRSEWYRSLWPSVVLTRFGETSFENTATGTREGVPFSSIIGKRGDRFVIDDPHSLDGAESEAERDKATRRFLEGGLNRVNDQMTSAVVVIMQRLHEGDLTGVLLARKLGFVHLMIPMEFEPERRCTTPIGWSDPRTFDGELMDYIRFPKEAVERQRAGSEYAWAGQYQQRPAPRGGGLFKREWFDGKFIDEAAIPLGTRFVRHWDLAGTKGGNGAYTAGVKMGKTRDGRYIIANVTRMREDGDTVRKVVRTTAEIDTRKTEISLPQDPGQAGKVQAADYLKLLDGFVAHAEPETGKKETRAEPFATQCQAGNVYLVRGPWNAAYIEELCAFPTAKIQDQVDASSGAYGRFLMSKEIKSSVTPLRL